MNNSIQAFSFQNENLRVINSKWFVAKDICSGLDIKDSAKAVRELDKQLSQIEKAAAISNRSSINTGGQTRKVVCVNETGVNLLIFQSRKKSAFNYKYWIASEVLPAIRKTGKYETPKEPQSLTKAQAGHVYNAVMSHCSNSGATYQSVFGGLKRHFQAASYKDIPSSQYPAVCEYLNIDPLEGEFIPKQKGGKVLRRVDEHRIQALCGHAKAVREWWRVAEPALRALQSPLAGRIHDNILDSMMFVRSIERDIKPRWMEL